jgi:7,8-didemethyl-8-hydroxy-5-deazariboflavin synthase CofH subunit
MTPITFVRLRPAESVNEIWAATRRREGSTTVEVSSLTAPDRDAALGGGLLPVAGPGGVEPAAWLVAPSDALDLADGDVPGWRITVLDEGTRATVLDAVARSRARYLRTGRSRIGPAADLAALPGLAVTVSVFVDTVEEAVAAVEAGAGDLVLRGWDTGTLGALRDALAPRLLVERTALPVGVPIDEVRRSLPEPLFTGWLGQVDGSGAARPRYRWAPGRDVPAPVPPRRLSAEWADADWVDADRVDADRVDADWVDADRVDAPAAGSLPGLAPELAGILGRSLDGRPPDRAGVERLFRARGREVEAVAMVADELRRRAVGDDVTYVVNRNINYTNMCTYRCGFCAFSRGPRSLNLRGEPYLMEIDEIVARAVEAWEQGATEVCLQGGIHPGFTGEFYLDVLRAIKAAVPDIHCHGFTPLEVWQGAETLGIPVAEFLERLRDAGLGTLPGTAAEILDDRVRRHLCPDKIRTAQWVEVMIAAHRLGLRSTSTIMFGHIDDPAAWAEHLEVLRVLQRRTGGITEFVPLPFVHMGAPIYLQGRSRPGPTWDEVVLVHAVARIAFDGLIPNIQASWVKLGLDAGIRLLDAGCNDLGGTLMNEIISRSAGASHGQMLQAADFRRAIRAAGRTPVLRTTVYGVVEAADRPR